MCLFLFPDQAPQVRGESTVLGNLPGLAQECNNGRGMRRPRNRRRGETPATADTDRAQPRGHPSSRQPLPRISVALPLTDSENAAVQDVRPRRGRRARQRRRRRRRQRANPMIRSDNNNTGAQPAPSTSHGSTVSLLMGDSLVGGEVGRTFS